MMNEEEKKNQKDEEKKIKVNKELYDEYLKHLKKELNELNNQMANLLGVNWEKQDDTKIAKMAVDIQECCKDKIYMEFVVRWFPSNKEYQQQYKETTSVYCMGWGVLMNEIIKNGIK